MGTGSEEPALLLLPRKGCTRCGLCGTAPGGTFPFMHIWVDADAMPREVKEVIYRAARRLELPTTLVANQRLTTPMNNPHVASVVVAGGPDVADQHIVDHSTPGDLAITADIPLASALVEKGVQVIDPRGEEYSAENIGERLSIRDFMDSLRSTGVETGGPSPYRDRDKREFAATLDRLLSAAMRKRAAARREGTPRAEQTGRKVRE